MSFQRPTGATLRRWCAGWLIAFALGQSLGAAAAFAAGPTYELLGHEAPDFALRAVTGGNVRLSEHRGDVVVLSFWGSRCSSCRAQLEALNKTLATYRSAGLLVFGISVDDDPSRAVQFAHGQTVSFALLLDPEKNVSRTYQVDNLPMTVLIDRSGVVRHVIRDYNSKAQETYLQQLRGLLNE